MDDISLELINIEIERVKTEINDTSIGLSMLTIFFLAIIPLFYTIMAVYHVTFQDIQIALTVSVTIVLLATILTVLHWENNKKKLHELYVKKETYLTTLQAKEAAAMEIAAQQKQTRTKKK